MAFLIKPQLDVDMYVWWSTISDSPIVWGIKKDFKKMYKKRKWMFRFGEDFKEKLKRADETGASNHYRGGHEGLRVGDGTLPWENIAAYLKIYETDLSMEPTDSKLWWLVDAWDVDDEDEDE